MWNKTQILGSLAFVPYPMTSLHVRGPAQGHSGRAAGGARGGVGSTKPQPGPCQPACQEWACLWKGLLPWGFPDICTLETGGWAQRQEILSKEACGLTHLPLSASLTAG